MTTPGRRAADTASQRRARILWQRYLKKVKYRAVVQRRMDYAAKETIAKGGRILNRAYQIHLINAVAEAYINMGKDIPEHIQLRMTNLIDRWMNDQDKYQHLMDGVLDEMALVANQQIYERYTTAFPGSPRDQGTPGGRRGGKMDAFLASGKGSTQGPLARVENGKLIVDYRDVEGNDSIPHFFRLNYGTKSATGREKVGASPPVIHFRLKGLGSAKSTTSDKGFPVQEKRSPAFNIPGRPFPFRIESGPSGQATLYYDAEEGTPRRPDRPIPSAGIAPSYFVERGVADMAENLQPLLEEALEKMRQLIGRDPSTGKRA